MKSSQGTTNIAIRIKEGIIVGVDSRSSKGEFITLEDKVKVFWISENMAYTTVESCYDCDRPSDHVKIEMKSAKDKPTVSEVAKMVHESDLKMICYVSLWLLDMISKMSFKFIGLI